MKSRKKDSIKKTKEGKPTAPSTGEIKALCRDAPGIDVIRQRLGSISWFMRSLNENIARRANREDGCKGRFWEGRFKCQVILDESALLTCMTYVDLNPVRAGAALSPETSPYTSAFLRIRARQARNGIESGAPECIHEKSPVKELDTVIGKGWAGVDRWLCPFEVDEDERGQGLLDLNLAQYLDLLDWTGRQVREHGKSIPENYEPILNRLKIDSEKWLDTVNCYGRVFYRAAGREKNMRQTASALGLRWLRGQNAGRKAFS